jgi:L,D-transpeptidase catalytic domain
VRGRTTVVATIAGAVAAFGIGVASASPAASRAPELALRWSAPTPADGTTYTVEVGTPLTIRLAVTRGAVISARGLPVGSTFTASGSAAVLTWTPTYAGVGSHPVVVVGRRPGTQLYTSPRTIFLYSVLPKPVAGTTPTPATPTPLSSPTLSRWGYLIRPAVARARPTSGSRVVGRLGTMTLDGTSNLALVLASAKDAKGRTWYLIRLAQLPNNKVGWVLWGAVSDLMAIRTYLVVDRTLLVATLYKNGRPVFRTRIGAGKSYWPTPTGDFYIREVLHGFNDPMYGPIAFGTSARSSVLTDWHGGGGVIGIHGTDEPEILPGHVSHGCIRMPNAAILRLHRLMPLGTPVAIR